MELIIHLNGLQSEFYNALSEGFEEEDKEKDGIFEIIKFDEHITEQVVDAFNSQEYYPQHMEGIVRLYNYLMIDLDHINKFCNYGIYQFFQCVSKHLYKNIYKYVFLYNYFVPF